MEKKVCFLWGVLCKTDNSFVTCVSVNILTGFWHVFTWIWCSIFYIWVTVAIFICKHFICKHFIWNLSDSVRRSLVHCAQQIAPKKHNFIWTMLPKRHSMSEKEVAHSSLPLLMFMNKFRPIKLDWKIQFLRPSIARVCVGVSTWVSGRSNNGEYVRVRMWYILINQENNLTSLVCEYVCVWVCVCGVCVCVWVGVCVRVNVVLCVCACVWRHDPKLYAFSALQVGLW